MIYRQSDSGFRATVEFYGKILRYGPSIQSLYNENNIYRVQMRKCFFGIPYWKTLVKTTSFKIANDAYDLMVMDEK